MDAVYDSARGIARRDSWNPDRVALVIGEQDHGVAGGPN